jgi:hypothetical protein
METSDGSHGRFACAEHSNVMTQKKWQQPGAVLEGVGVPYSESFSTRRNRGEGSPLYGGAYQLDECVGHSPVARTGGRCPKRNLSSLKFHSSGVGGRRVRPPG